MDKYVNDSQIATETSEPMYGVAQGVKADNFYPADQISKRNYKHHRHN